MPHTLTRALCALCLLICVSSTFAQEGDEPRFEYRFEEGDPIAYGLDLKQRVKIALKEGEPQEVSAHLTARVVCEFERRDPNGQLTINLIFSDLAGTFTAGGQPVEGVELSQLGELRMSATIKPDGAVVRTLMPSINPQIDRTMRLLQDAILRALPIMPEPSKATVGSSWSESQSKRQDTKGSTVSTEMTRRFTLKGIEGDGNADIAISLDVQISSLLKDPQGTGERKGQGKGQGTAVFDLARGRLVKVDLGVDYRSEGEGGASQDARVEVTLSRIAQ